MADDMAVSILVISHIVRVAIYIIFHEGHEEYIDID